MAEVNLESEFGSEKKQPVNVTNFDHLTEEDERFNLEDNDLDNTNVEPERILTSPSDTNQISSKVEELDAEVSTLHERVTGGENSIALKSPTHTPEPPISAAQKAFPSETGKEETITSFAKFL